VPFTKHCFPDPNIVSVSGAMIKRVTGTRLFRWFEFGHTPDTNMD